MAIFVDPIQFRGTKRFDQIVSFHHNAQSDVFCQEILVPFFLMLMSVHPTKSSPSTLVVCTPEAEFQMNGEEIKGRSPTSQHQHNCFEFTYVLEGSMYQIVEGKQYFYPTGSCCLLNRNTLHTEETSTDFTCLFLSISPGLVQQLLNSAGVMLFPEERPIFNNLIYRFLQKNLLYEEKNNKDFLDFVPRIGHDEQVRIVHQIFEDMLQTLLAPGDGATFCLLGHLQKLIGVLCREDYYHGEYVNANSSMESLLFSRIDQLLDQRHGRITNKELSEILNYNGSYLGRIVKKYTGQSLFDYSMGFAMEYAAKQLASTEKSIAEIAAELNFSNRSHFYKLFRERYGMSPMQYKKGGPK